MKEGRETDRRQSQRSIRKARTSPRLESSIFRRLSWGSPFVRPLNPLCCNLNLGGRTCRSAPLSRHARIARDERTSANREPQTLEWIAFQPIPAHSRRGCLHSMFSVRGSMFDVRCFPTSAPLCLCGKASLTIFQETKRKPPKSK
jgi:hypothetical protein